MPIDLNKVLGGLLTDISRARSISDCYSRDLALVYEQDPLLRLFPVPRADFKNVVIELKFAITNVETVPAESGSEAEEEYVTEVSVTTDELQDLPESAISTLRFCADIEDYTWVTVEENTEGDQVMLVKS